MKRVLTGFLMTLLLVTPVLAGADQSTDDLLKQLDQLDANLKSLASKKAADKRVATRKQNIQNKIASLSSKMKKLEKAWNSEQPNQEQIVSLMTEVTVLKAEIRELNRTGEKKAPVQLAATNNQAEVSAFSAPAESHEPEASESALEGIEMSGFVDVVHSFQKSATDESEFGLGQAEIDLESQVSERAGIALAVAYNNESGGFELGAAELGINLLSNESSFINSIDFVAGQFDVPFGIDLNFYPSVDRKLITAPWFAETHGGWRGWNDFGFQVGLSSEYGNWVGYAVNGFESSAEVLDAWTSLTTGVDTYEEIDTTPANAFGSRLGVTPVSGLEIGGSFAFGLNRSSRNEMTLAGADIQYTIADLYLKGEYVHHSVNRSIAKESHQGYYFQSTYSFNQAFVAARYESFKGESTDEIGRFTIGVGYEVVENVELRLETIAHEISDNNATSLQLVTGF